MNDLSDLTGPPDPARRPRCLQPWQSLVIDAAGNVQPCGFRGNYTNTVNAEPLGNLHTESLAEIWNGPVAQRVRTCMAAGDLHGAGCGACLAVNQGNVLGLQVAEEIVPNTDYATNMALKVADIRAARAQVQSKPTVVYYTPSHLCNLRCAHCYQNTTRRLTTAKDDEVLELLPVLSEIVAGGGEPLILPMWRRLLANFDPAINPHLRLSTTTNATVLRDDVMAGLAALPHLTISVSIDGIGATFEAIRKRARWPEVLANTQRLRALVAAKNGRFSVGMSVMKQNVAEIAAVFDLTASLDTLINLQPVVAYPVDCSLRCFNDPPQDWPAQFEAARAAARRLVLAGRNDLDSLDANDRQVLASLIGHVDEAERLVPWAVLAKPHQRRHLQVPAAHRGYVDFLRQMARDQRWDRGDVVVVLAQDGAEEPHWFAPIDADGAFAVSLPAGSFTAWPIQIDSIPMTATYAAQQSLSWRVEE